ncbi:MAG: phage tail tape measure protein [Gammaproteobacteria bacterium]|nr:phage tail tape measure protein [Gammaproteobacteria bacterium]
MANPVLQLIITAKDQASSVLSSLKTQLATLGTAIAAAFSVKEAAQFEKAMDAIRARADATGPALDQLIARARDAAQTLGPQFGYSATEAAGGIKELIAAGFSGEEALQALKGTLALAALEGINVAQSATLISDAISQFGLNAGDATKVADILAKSAGAVAATATDMAEALKYTGNAASQAGLSLTETSATLDVLAKAGQRGSEAGTGLASVLSILDNPTHAATKALYDMGATSTQLADVLDFLQKRGLNASETIALFGEQGGRVINTLLAQGGTKAINDFADQITHAGKSAEDTAKIMQANLLGAFDRFWESLKRVGTELATPKLEPFAKGLDRLTEALNTFASNEKIHAFQAAIAEGFTAIYTRARAFADQIDWNGVSTTIGNTFDRIKSAIDSALTSIQSIYASLTGSLPNAASIAQRAGEGIKAAWEGVGIIAQGAADGLSRIAESLSGPVAVGADVAQRAIAALTGTTDQARETYDTLNSALKAGTVNQDQVTTAWERLQLVMADAQSDIEAAQVAYNAVVAAQQAGTATQEQVRVAWQNLQTVMSTSQERIESARLAYDGLNLQFTTGKGLTEAVKLAHDRLNGAIDTARTAIERITDSVKGQTTGFQALWEVLQNTAPESLKKTWDSLTTSAGNLLAGLNKLVQYGSGALAGFIENADLSPVRDLFSKTAEAAKQLVSVIIESFPAAEKAGANLADSFTVAWSGVVGILSAVVSGTLKVVEVIGRATFEVGKYFDRYSKEEIAKIEANLNGLSESAGEFAAVAARSFESSGKAIDRMRERAQEAEKGQKALGDAGKAAAQEQEALATATERTAKAHEQGEKGVTALAFALQKQRAEVEQLAKADLSSEEAKQKHATATQKLWDLEEAFGEAVKGLTSEQFANVSANEQVQQSLAQLGTVVENGGIVLEKYAGSVQRATPSLEKLQKTMETTHAELERVEEAYKNGTLRATENKSVIEQLNEARKKATDGLNVYQNALDNNITKEKESVETAERKRQAVEAIAQSNEALIDASLKLAEIEGNEQKIAELTAQKKEAQAEASQKVAEYYQQEAEAAQRVAEALRLKYEALKNNDPTNQKAIQQAKEAADAANAEAVAKKAVAIETAAVIPVLQKEAEQAAKMAGPIGQLIRLYQDRTKELTREANAVERFHAGKVRDLETEKAQAEAKGDTVKAAKLSVEIKEAEAEQAEALALAKNREYKAEIDLLEASKLAISFDEKVTAAGQEKLKQIDEQIAKLRELMEIEHDKAESARAAADAEKNLAEEAKQSGDAQEEAHNRASESAQRVYQNVSTLIEGYEGLTEAGKAFAEAANITGEFRGLFAFGEAVQAATDHVLEALDAEKALNAEVERLVEVSQGVGPVADEAHNRLLFMAREGALEIKGLTEAGEQARQTLEDIKYAALDAEQALAEMAADFNKQILQLQGDQQGLLDLEQAERLQQLEDLYAQAGKLGDAEYRRAKAQAEALYQLKLQQLQDESDATVEKTVKSLNAITTASRSAVDAISALTNSSLAGITQQADRLYRSLAAIDEIL